MTLEESPISAPKGMNGGLKQVHFTKGSKDARLIQTVISDWWYSYPSEKYESRLGWLFPIYGKIKNVPNHQPDLDWLLIRVWLHHDFSAKWNGWRCWRNKSLNMTRILDPQRSTKIHKDPQRLKSVVAWFWWDFVFRIFSSFFAGGYYRTIIHISCGSSSASATTKVPCPSRKTLYCKPDSKVITPAIVLLHGFSVFLSGNEVEMQKDIFSISHSTEFSPYPFLASKLTFSA